MPEFKAKAVRLLAESRSSYSSETAVIAAVAKDLGINFSSCYIQPFLIIK